METETATNRKRSTSIRLAIAALAVGLASMATARRAEAWTTSSSGSTATVYESAPYIGCNSFGGWRTVQVNGPYVWAVNGLAQQKALVDVHLWWWNGSSWVRIDTDSLGWIWVHPGTGYGRLGDTVFGPADGVTSSGYYTATVEVKWYTATNAYIGTRTVHANSYLDFWGSGTTRYNGSCYLW